LKLIRSGMFRLDVLSVCIPYFITWRRFF
jgi:hypothetical protein